MAGKIIKDIHGGTLRLSKTRLTELTGCAIDGECWYLPLKNLRKPSDGPVSRLFNGWTFVTIYLPAKGNIRRFPRTGEVTLGRTRIGCRNFSKETMAQILKAAGLGRKRGN
jgi:hypothetical protein